jgi:hypothetical protein
MIPQLDWQAIFAAGKDYPTWLAGGESAENQAKMETLYQALAPEPAIAARLQALPRPVRIVAIAEDWCGDVVRHVPALRRLAEAAADVQIRFLSREQEPGLFTRFLTNGGEAIPKFIFLSEAWVECGNWGPMPEDCRELIARGKACGNVGAARQQVSARYAEDPGQRQVFAELTALLERAACLQP